MKYIYQIFIIFSVTLIAELMHYFIPIPVPASIYGLILMLVLLCTGIIKIHHIEKTADFLVEIMPLMFIPGGVGLVTAWTSLKPIIIPVTVIMSVSTVVVMAVTGKTTELVMRLDRKRKEKRENEQCTDR